MTENEIDSFDFRIARADLLTRVARRVEASIEEPIDSPIERVYSFLANGSDDFVDTITAVNRILTKNHQKNSTGTYLADREIVILQNQNPSYAHILPTVEDKEPLLGYLYDTLVTMYNNDADADHIAAVLGYGINAIHPFNDANGRTARAMHAVLTTSISEDFTNILHFSGIDTVKNTDSLSPEVFESGVYDSLKAKLGTHTLENGQLVPKIQIAASMNTIDALTKEVLAGGQRAHDIEIIASALRDPNVGQITAGMLDKSGQVNQLVASSVGYYGPTRVFNMDHFYPRATDADIQFLKQTIRSVHNTYVAELLNFIGGEYTNTSTITVNTNEKGLVTLSVSDYISQMARQAISRVE